MVPRRRTFGLVGRVGTGCLASSGLEGLSQLTADASSRPPLAPMVALISDSALSLLRFVAGGATLKGHVSRPSQICHSQLTELEKCLS